MTIPPSLGCLRRGRPTNKASSTAPPAAGSGTSRSWTPIRSTRRSERTGSYSAMGGGRSQLSSEDESTDPAGDFLIGSAGGRDGGAIAASGVAGGTSSTVGDLGRGDDRARDHHLGI